jgi:hypothetical protein
MQQSQLSLYGFKLARRKLALSIEEEILAYCINSPLRFSSVTSYGRVAKCASSEVTRGRIPAIWFLAAMVPYKWVLTKRFKWGNFYELHDLCGRQRWPLVGL